MRRSLNPSLSKSMPTIFYRLNQRVCLIPFIINYFLFFFCFFAVYDDARMDAYANCALLQSCTLIESVNPEVTGT